MNKVIMYIAIGLIAGLIASCNAEDSRLNEALELAGENRGELEAVLDHTQTPFSTNGRDCVGTTSLDIIILIARIIKMQNFTLKIFCNIFKINLCITDIIVIFVH